MVSVAMGDPRLPREFWDQVEPAPSGCWTFTGYVINSGYGIVYTSGKQWLVHRLAYHALVGAIPDGLQVDHACHNLEREECRGLAEKCPHRLCVNPEHLQLATHKKNTLSGNAASAVHARKTHCKWGHEFTPENTHMKPYKYGLTRECRACRRVREKAARERKSLAAL